MTDEVALEADVVVVGSGGAGMYAALVAARDGADVLLLDRSLIGRGGATVMAQMTVAAAIGHAEPDDWRAHLADTLAAGRGLNNEVLARVLCEEAPDRILEMAEWHVGWARDGEGIAQAMAPGHSARRCVYVDFLDTGPAVSRTLRARLARAEGVRRLSDLVARDIVLDRARTVGIVAHHLISGRAVAVAAGAVVLATGGLTRLYARNSASANMGGDGFALALKAGASLVDMEFVQFFPIGHLAPRMIGMDPIMWDPFRYKLGGRLLNSEGEEFTARYGVAEDGRYKVARDLATYAIIKEVEAGRGSPHGGAWLSFEHIPEADLRAAFGPVIDRLAANGIDLTQTAIEVSPIAHYHMGGVVVDESMESEVAGLFAAGELVGGPGGANRLSGNAVSEALVFGARAGASAARRAREDGRSSAMGAVRAALGARADVSGGEAANGFNPAARILELQALMNQGVGPFRDADGLGGALARIEAMREELAAIGPPRAVGAFDPAFLDSLDLDNMLLTAEAITRAALARTESRGAHQREDHPEMDETWTRNLHLRLSEAGLSLEPHPVVRERAA